MGKKSRKKGGEDKKSRKEKLQERRERVEEQLANNFSEDINDDDRITEHSVLPGDIVWFDKEEYEYYNRGYDNPDPNDYRGVVREVSPALCKVQPISHILRGDSSCVDIDRFAHYLRRDV